MAAAQRLKLSTPPMLTGHDAPQPLKQHQRAAVEKLINIRYGVLLRVLNSAKPPPTEETLGSEISHGRYGNDNSPSHPKIKSLYDDAIKHIKAYNAKRAELVEQRENQTTEHHHAVQKLRMKLENERDSCIARLHLESATEAVKTYLDKLPSLESIMPELEKLGVTPDDADRLLVASTEPVAKRR